MSIDTMINIADLLSEAAWMIDSHIHGKDKFVAELRETAALLRRDVAEPPSRPSAAYRTPADRLAAMDAGGDA